MSKAWATCPCVFVRWATTATQRRIKAPTAASLEGSAIWCCHHWCC